MPLRPDIPDLARFAENVARRVGAGEWGLSASDQNRDGPIFIARAPGRLDVMGGIADYSGSLVLQWPIREATRVAVRPWSEPRLLIRSLGHDGEERRADVPLEVVADASRSYDDVRAWFAADHSRHWAGYVAGVFHVLTREHGVRFDRGATILIESDVPVGKGVSSSAAIEAATMEAITAAWQIAIDARTRAIRCQQVENLVVGAPCGVMDQMASICGQAGQLMSLLCQPAELLGTLRLPASLAVWGIDSGLRHAVTGSDYGDVRVGAFMGYRIIAELAGLEVAAGDRPGRVRVHDPRWHGYLANVGSQVFRELSTRIPEALQGAEFLARYQGTTDVVTQVNPARRYAVRIPAGHPVFEHERVVEWARSLTTAAESKAGTLDARRLGTLMYESHASYSACGLGSEGTDRLVALAREAGPGKGVYGAKITGGGSGGTVAILTDTGADDTIRSIARQYARETSRAAHVFEGTSPGAAEVGALRLDPA
jgi:L-arabinokinase